MKPYNICGVDIERVNVPGPYVLLVKFTDGDRWKEIERGHNPNVVYAAHNKVARNPRVIDRIEFHDGTGCLETIWSRDWT